MVNKKRGGMQTGSSVSQSARSWWIQEKGLDGRRLVSVSRAIDSVDGVKRYLFLRDECRKMGCDMPAIGKFMMNYMPSWLLHLKYSLLIEQMGNRWQMPGDRWQHDAMHNEQQWCYHTWCMYILQSSQFNPACFVHIIDQSTTFEKHKTKHHSHKFNN